MKCPTVYFKYFQQMFLFYSSKYKNFETLDISVKAVFFQRDNFSGEPIPQISI